MLAKIKAFDPSFANPSEAMALAWSEVIAPWNLSQEDLLAAVTDWYRHHGTADRHPLVADIVKNARAIRNDRMDRMDPDDRPTPGDLKAAPERGEL